MPSIHSVHSVETFVHCINCGRRLVHATAGKFVQCPRCSTYMRTTNCSTKKCARIVVQSDDNLQHLTAFEDVLKEACPDLSLMSEGILAELLLDMNNVTITYDASNRTIKKISLQKWAELLLFNMWLPVQHSGPYRTFIFIIWGKNFRRCQGLSLLSGKTLERTVYLVWTVSVYARNQSCCCC